MKHTPGPWDIADIDWDMRGNARYSLAGIKKVSAADARLIAAAPDLLAALKEARDYVVDYGSERMMAPVVEAIDAAIAKAEL